MPDPRDYGLAVQVERDPAGNITGLGLDDALKGLAEQYDGPMLDTDIAAIGKADFGIPYPIGKHEIEGEVAAVRVYDDGAVELVSIGY